MGIFGEVRKMFYVYVSRSWKPLQPLKPLKPLKRLGRLERVEQIDGLVVPVFREGACRVLNHTDTEEAVHRLDGRRNFKMPGNEIDDITSSFSGGAGSGSSRW